MYKRLLVLLVVFGFGAASPASASALKPEWKGALNLSTEDKSTKLKIGGRIHQDWAFITGDDDLEAQLGVLEDGTEFRRARLYISGQVDDVVEFKAQYDLAKGTASFKDVYVGLTSTPLFGAGVRIGQFYQPMGLEVLTSSNSILAMERAPTSLFAPDRQTGLMLHRPVLEERATWAASVFRPSSSQGKAVGDDEWNVAGRVTALAWANDGSADLLHLGAAVSRQESADNTFELDVETEANLMPEFGVLMAPADSWVTFSGEAALVLGPFAAQAELVTTQTSAPTGGTDGSFQAYYALLSWFLTGEQLPYKKSGAVFGGVKPNQNYGQGGKGAIQAVARVSRLDLEDGDLRGGTIDAITLGLNWYLNPNARVMLNYVRSDGEGASVDEDDMTVEIAGVSHSFQTRFQVNF